MAIEERTSSKGRKSFRAKVKDKNGNWFSSQSFLSKEEALQDESRLSSLKQKGKVAISRDAKEVSLREYWEVWSIENRQEISQGWKISQDQMFRDYIDPLIGHLKMIDVGVSEIGNVLSSARDLGRSSSTLKMIYVLLNKMFSDAVEYYEMLERNPVKAKFHRPKSVKTKREFLRPEEAYRLLEFVKESYLGPPIWIQTLAGLRPSEVQGLRWSDLDFERNQLLISRIYNNKTGSMQKFPKQREWAYAPIVPLLKAFLLGLHRQESEFVCQGPKGSMLSYETYLRALRTACDRSGVRRVTPHELRHSCTEIWITNGASGEDIRRLLNHASISSTATYIHRTDDRLNELGSKLRLVPMGN